MLKKQAGVEDLFPTARELFAVVRGKPRRANLPLYAWLLAGAIAILVGQRIVHWIDRNL